MNTGHEELSCAACHRPAPGTVRQQLQAKIRFAVGLRAEPVDFGLAAVTVSDCLECHDRPDDRHPTYRFLEPRFRRARSLIQPQRCVSCHQEHTGRRVTVEGAFCRHCHEGLALEDDPLEPSHQSLAEDRRFDTCLRCHDFHGNHVMKTPDRLKQAVEQGQIEAYLEGGAVPYPKEKRWPAKRSRGGEN